MPATINVAVHAREAQKFLTAVERKQIPFATSNAINTVAFESKKRALPKAMAQDLDRPTRFTKNAFNVEKSTKRTLRAEVYAKPIQDVYLAYQVDGGTRTPKKRANTVPRNIALNAYGNLSKNAVKRMLANKKRFFSGQPKGRRNRPPGIWERVNKNKKIALRIEWEGPVSYQPRLDVVSAVTREVRKTFGKEFDRQLRRALASA